MRLSTAVKFIVLAHASCYVPSVLCKKGSMGDDTTTATTEHGFNDERMLASSSSMDYAYRRNYLAIIEPNNFVTLFPFGGGISDQATKLVDAEIAPQLQGSSTILNGKVYDPADIEIINKFKGTTTSDIPKDFITIMPMDLIGLPFAGGRQPKLPIPPGDSAFFYHGYCVATSALSAPLPEFGTVAPSTIRPLPEILPPYIDSLTVSSHSCKLNICLGGGGFDCIALYSGTSFVFNVGQQVNAAGIGLGPFQKNISLPPPFPATIIGGTGSFEGIEGTADIATICGTTGPIIQNNARRLTTNIDSFKIGLIVQTISINANMPLPVAP